MMKKCLFFVMLLIGGFFYAQKTPPNLKVIKKNLENKKSEFNFEKLIFKYKGLPKSLDNMEAQHLYYGRNFQKTVSTSSTEFKNLADAFKDKDVDETINLAKEVYGKDPTNLDVLLILLRGYDTKKDISNFSHHMNQLKSLTDAIKNSGDGKSDKTAYVVNSVGDEYILLNMLNIGQDYNRGSQSANGAMYDVWQKGEEKLYIKVLY